MKGGSKAKPKKPEHHRGGVFSRARWLEILVFVALAVFVFSVVSSLLGSRADEIIVNIASGGGGLAEVAESPVLYEAPSQREAATVNLSPIFTPSVLYWEDDILEWSEEYGIDPNAAATLMQIESCGDPDAESYVGAAGLFQVMPFHFAEGEDRFEPDTNALRGLEYFADGLDLADGHAGLAMAGYNGGHGLIGRAYENWPHETQRYYRWGSGIYREASAGWESSPTLESWLDAGGSALCETATAHLDITAAGR